MRERRKVLALNKLGDAATLVRRGFVRKLLARKTPPKGAALFVGRVLVRDSYLPTNHNALDTTAALLGLDSAEAVASRCLSCPPMVMVVLRCSRWRWSWARWKAAHPRRWR